MNTEGWSIKSLHRLIMLSSVYQESSEGNPRYAQIDPENRLLWRANIRRMDFEEVRDSILAIGGKLDETLFGRPVNLGSYPYSMRRTIYGFIDRNNVPEVYNQFDFANPEITMGKRYETIVPQQSLFLMNSPLVVEQARNLVDRPDFKCITNEADRVTLLYEPVYEREPTPVEIKLGLNFVVNSPEYEQVPVMSTTKQGRVKKKKNVKLDASFASIPTGERKPLTPWEKYADACCSLTRRSSSIKRFYVQSMNSRIECLALRNQFWRVCPSHKIVRVFAQWKEMGPRLREPGGQQWALF